MASRIMETSMVNRSDAVLPELFVRRFPARGASPASRCCTAEASATLMALIRKSILLKKECSSWPLVGQLTQSVKAVELLQVWFKDRTTLVSISNRFNAVTVKWATRQSVLFKRALRWEIKILLKVFTIRVRVGRVTF